MDVLSNSTDIHVRAMNYDDIPLICRADCDESEKNKTYLKNQLANQEKHECSALIALYNGEVAGDVAEGIAKKHCDKVYLDVCLNSEYGPAQRFYIKRGYVPDGKGAYYGERVCATNAICKNDDEFTLCLVKEL